MLNPQKRGIVWSRENLGYVWLLRASLGLNILYFTGMVIWRLEIGILLNVGSCAKTHRMSIKKRRLFQNTRNLRAFEGCVSTWPNSLSCMWWPSKPSVLEMERSPANKNGISLYFFPSFSLSFPLSPVPFLPIHWVFMVAQDSGPSTTKYVVQDKYRQKVTL